MSDVLVIRGRRFTRATIRAVRHDVSKHFSRGRTHISIQLCRKLNWRQPNGWLKDRACRHALRKLEELGFVSLPPRIAKPFRGRPPRTGQSSFQSADYSHADLTLIWAKGNKAEITWNDLVQKHHYLGHRVVVGRCIKYLVKQRNEIVAAICFSSAAWNLKQRNVLLSELGIPPWEIRDLVINNSRFLLLVKGCANMASRILALATSRIATDWFNYYSIRPRIIETFVEPRRFEGTCYKAANWLMIGTTRGFKKVGATHLNSQPPKLIFVYGLNPATRCRLPQLFAPEK